MTFLLQTGKICPRAASTDEALVIQQIGAKPGFNLMEQALKPAAHSLIWGKTESLGGPPCLVGFV